MSWMLLLVMTVSSVSAASLSPAERERVRYKLQNYANELELIIRNQRSDQSMNRRQKREIELLGIYSSIPLTRDLDGLKTALQESAQDAGLKDLSVSVIAAPSRPPRIPTSVYVDQPVFRLKPEHLAEEIPMVLMVTGARKNVMNWIRGWPDDLIRGVELRGNPKRPARLLGHATWSISAKTYRFWPIRFPRLRLRDPVELLPTELRRDTLVFAKEEPVLWSLVLKSRQRIPQAAPLFDRRREYLLDKARIRFYLSRSFGPRSLSAASK